MDALFSSSVIASVREKFWCVTEDSWGTPRIFCDSAAGSLVLRRAQAAIERYSRISSYGGGVFPDSLVVDELAEASRVAVADLLNAPSPKRIFTGESATAVLRRLADAILPSLPSRSRLILSAADHNANIDAWRQTAAHWSAKQFDVQIVRFEPATGTVDLAHLESLSNERVRLVALSHGSNVLGAENPLREVRELLDRKSPDALLIVDGVHFIAHGPVDVSALRADAYVLSSYKIFAQRGLSVAYLSDRLARLPHYKLAPAPDQPPESWEWGFRNPADLAPLIEVRDYLAWLGNECFPASAASTDLRDRVRRGQIAIRQYENRLVRALLDGVGTTPGLPAIEGVTVYGLQDPRFYHLKEPTVAFTVRGRTSDEVASAFWQQARIAVRSGNHYAQETHRHLGVSDTVRVSLAHYNTVEEVRCLLEALDDIVRRAHGR